MGETCVIEFFLTKDQNIKVKKKWGGGMARVSECFFFTKNPNFFWGDWWVEGSRVSVFFY